MRANGYATPAYSFIDERPLPGINYYRLLLINIDGSRKYSKKVRAEAPTNIFSVSFYPNPVKDQLKLELKAGSGAGIITVTDISGRLV